MTWRSEYGHWPRIRSRAVNRFVADDTFWIAVHNINERKRPKTDKKILPEADKFLFSLSSSNNVVMETHVRSGYDEAWPAS